jgi:RNA polymerase sigma factor (sigma-70 family)
MSEHAKKHDYVSRLAETYLPLVETIALEYHNTPNTTYDELVSEGRVALLSAARLFDPRRGNSISYASTAIRNRLNDLYEKQVRLAQVFPQPIDSRRPTEESTKAGLEYADDTADVRLAARRSESARILRETLGRLPRRLQIVLHGIEAGKTYDEIGAELGITKQGVYKLAQPGTAPSKSAFGRERLRRNRFQGAFGFEARESGRKIALTVGVRISDCAVRE